jgi:ribosome-associated protein
MVVATGTSQRHLMAMGDKLIHKLKGEFGLAPRSEGGHDSGWLLIDAGDVIVHLFRAETRAFYDLEKLWSVAPPERRAAQAG